MQTIPFSVSHIDDAELALDCVSRNINIWLDAMTEHAEQGNVEMCPPRDFPMALRLQMSAQSRDLRDRKNRLTEDRHRAHQPEAGNTSS